jgi:hypothetical protein
MVGEMTHSLGNGDESVKRLKHLPGFFAGTDQEGAKRLSFT